MFTTVNKYLWFYNVFNRNFYLIQHSVYNGAINSVSADTDNKKFY